ncbi:MAG: alpha/beta hydrolase, partial [Deltaproteobacteria bacterium]|nr:alpha/beta hydrolase [Deltaproteobacteria bacterium]
MDTHHSGSHPQFVKTFLGLFFCLILLLGAVVLASSVQTDFGRVEVSNVVYPNFNGISVRAKLFKPVGVSRNTPAPGAVYIHGYQNNRETGDAYSIELARRGFVVLNIDAIGRGNSGEPGDPRLPGFDETYGGKTSVQYLRQLPFVQSKFVGILGHSLGAEMAYTVALDDPTIQALVITGFAYTLKSSATQPRNMLMIIGKWDEFRQRMTGTRDIEKDWMQTEQTKRVFPVPSPQIGMTYGDFGQGTARKVFIPRITHVQESHDSASIAQTVEWMRDALRPNPRYWIDKNSQTWWIKEYATLAAMLAGLASILPLGLILLRTNFFGSIRRSARWRYFCSLGAYLKFSAINALLLWLYLPLILALFGVHKYVLPIDKFFPMMMVNGIVWWFLWVNIIGALLFWVWYRKQKFRIGLTLTELGISLKGDRRTSGGKQLLKTILLAGILFAFAYG